MATLHEIHVHYRTKDGEMEVIQQKPTSQDTQDVKLDVGRIVQTIKQSGDAEYYYVVLKAKKTDGTFGYRTVIPKTLL